MLCLAAAPGRAEGPSQILVSATGLAKTPPDRVTIGFNLRGEGTTSDEAVAKLRDDARRVNEGTASLLGNTSKYHASNLTIAQVRSRECDASPYGQQRLSVGPCAVIGYVATMPASIDTPRVAEAGTLTGLISQLGGVDVGIHLFWLSDQAAARRRAMQAALANAHDQAGLIAEGSGAKLGPLLRVQDADYQEISLEPTATPLAEGPPTPPPPPPPPPPPIQVDMAPQPIQTTVRLMVAYAINR